MGKKLTFKVNVAFRMELDTDYSDSDSPVECANILREMFEEDPAILLEFMSNDPDLAGKAQSYDHYIYVYPVSAASDPIARQTVLQPGVSI